MSYFMRVTVNFTIYKLAEYFFTSKSYELKFILRVTE